MYKVTVCNFYSRPMQKHNIPYFPVWSLHLAVWKPLHWFSEIVMLKWKRQWQCSKEKDKSMFASSEVFRVLHSALLVLICFDLTTFSASVFYIPYWETTAKRIFHMVCEDPETHYGSSPARQCWESNCEIAIPEGQYTGRHVTVAFQWTEPPSHHNKWC